MRKFYNYFLTASLFIFGANQASAQCTENFDGVVAPALPVGWTTTTLISCAGSLPWATTTTLFDSPPNSIGTNDPNCISDVVLVSPNFPITSPTAQITFRRNNNLETNFDGMVLEISLSGGPFTDIITAGGSFVVGGYNGTISTAFGSPIGGRQAWTGNSGGWVTTTINLPAAANGQIANFRWRRATDNSVASVGVNIDGISITGCSLGGPCAENFDGVVAPALPALWVATTAIDCAGSNPWATVNTLFDSPPNSAFANDPGCVSDEFLDSRPMSITSPAAVLTFRRNNNLETNFDGMVLEISIGGGPFTDIITAGGSFVAGAYNGTISTGFSSPIGGRQAWTGNSGGWVTTTINLPAAANGQNIVLRWRRATDSSVAGVGANIDGISITGSNCGVVVCAGTPTAGAISGPATSCNGAPTVLTLSGQSSLPGITIQWKSSTVSGGPYTNIGGATSSTYNFTASSGTTYYIATVTCNVSGFSANTAQHTLLVGNPVHSAVSSTVTTACSPGAATITGTVSGGVMVTPMVLGNSGTINLAIPDANTTGVGSTISLPNTVLTAATDLKVRINARHTWVGDLKFTLTSPCGTTLLFDQPGVPASGFGNSDNLGTSSAAPPPPAVYTFDLAGATVIPETASAGFVPAGTYQPSNAGGAAHTWAGLTFPCTVAGNWTLTISDHAGGDVGDLIDWQILGPPTYIHTLTGPGTITQNAPTGTNNSTANFTVTNIPFGNQNYVLTSTDAIGCTVNSNVSVLIKQTPVISFVQTPANPICNGQIQQIVANVAPPILQTFTQIGNTQVPGGQPTLSTGPADPYSSNIVVSGVPVSGVSVKSVRLGNINHTFPDDIDVVLVSPTGVPVILMSDAGAGADAIGLDYVLDDAAAGLLADNTLSPAGTYRPTNYGVPDAFVAPGPGSLSQATPTLSTFGTGNHNGTWRLYVVDDAGGDIGYIGNWSITFNIPPTVVFSPITNLYLDAAATIPYAGTPVTVVYAKPPTTTVYTVNTTVDGCSSSNTVTVTVNQVPAITVQPSPATQTICQGFNVTYTVTATGTGLTYQWRKDAVNLVNNAQISGVTTNTLTINAVTSANSGSYTVVVSGSCPPAVTSSAAVLNVATTPVISTQPANQTRCVGQNAVFTVANTGSVPPPTIFQWQVSTDAGVTWTNLLTGGSFTNTLTVSNVQLTDNNKRYRVIITNSCGQTITSNAATLTVNAIPVVTVNTLPRICISDTLVPLVGTPVGGSWSGIGVSGFNFVPPVTAIGTFTLTYTYTNAAGCVATGTTIAKVEDCPERLRLLRDNAAIIYPNPNNGHFNIKMNSTLYSYLGMRVYTTSGQQVHVQSWGGLAYGRVIPVNLSFLPSGSYMVKLYYDDGVRSADKTFQVVIGRN